jgi:3-hydroxyacyl-CoA dehydrogenase/enoyl-CoA hydratase/3-hydroxybutyryl-CoA epimerase
VVNDSPGFYTSRVFSTFAQEGLQMLEEGVAPALIENAARLAGMPVGPLAVSDEVSIDLQWKIMQQREADLGAKYRRPVGYEVVRRFVKDLGRRGRRFGAGFYEYPKDGRKFLWPGLSSLYPPLPVQPSVEELKSRFLCIQALETVRCVEEGVIDHPADADVGSVLAWGFPAWTGGTLSYIDTLGVSAFVAECQRLARVYGPRFRPTRGLKGRAVRGELFHGAG